MTRQTLVGGARRPAGQLSSSAHGGKTHDPELTPGPPRDSLGFGRSSLGEDCPGLGGLAGGFVGEDVLDEEQVSGELPVGC